MRKLGIEQAVRANLTGEEGVEWVDSQSQVWAKFPALGLLGRPPLEAAASSLLGRDWPLLLGRDRSSFSRAIVSCWTSNFNKYF